MNNAEICRRAERQIQYLTGIGSTYQENAPVEIQAEHPRYRHTLLIGGPKGIPQEFNFFNGSGQFPRRTEVLECLVMDAERAGTRYSEFLDNFGEQDSPEERRIHELCRLYSKRLRRAFGPDYKTLLLLQWDALAPF